MNDNKKISVRVHAAVIDGHIYRNCIVTYFPADNKVSPSIVRFSTELQSTTSYNGIIIFAPEGFEMPPEFDMPHALAAPGCFTDFLASLASVVPHCGTMPHEVILLPL